MKIKSTFPCLPLSLYPKQNQEWQLVLEYQNKQMAIEFGFKKRNRMCRLRINRGVILELGQTEAGSWATERAKLGRW